MNKFLEILKTCFIGGALIVFPAWLAALLMLKVLLSLQGLVKPLSSQLPESVGHPIVLAVFLLIFFCFMVGALIRTAVGHMVKNAVEQHVLEHLPGYSMLRNVARQLGDVEGDNGFKPAFVEIEEALAPGFLIETHSNGLCTVFIPSAPTPAAGNIYIIDSARVHPLDVPVTTMMMCITKWGSNSGELVAAFKKGHEI